MRITTIVACLSLLASSISCDGPKSSETRIAFVTNGVASFWVIAEKGARAAGKDTGTVVTVHMPVGGVVDQKQILEDLLAKQVGGIAVSPIDPKNQTGLLDKVGERTLLITHDSDAPDSKRLVYIGMDNYTAGRMCAKLVKEAIPDGGEVCMFVGRFEQDNGRKRRQGIIDELLGRSNDPERYDLPGSPIRGDKYTIVATLTDQFDRAVGKANVEDAISKYPKLACMIGLFADNAPDCLNALKQAGKLGQIQVIAFDEAEPTLAGIQQGNVYGTVVQDPYMYGYRSVEVLKALLDGDESVIPESKFIDIPARLIRKGNVDAFWVDLKKKMVDSK